MTFTIIIFTLLVIGEVLLTVLHQEKEGTWLGRAVDLLWWGAWFAICCLFDDLYSDMSWWAELTLVIVLAILTEGMELLTDRLLRGNRKKTRTIKNNQSL